MAKENQFKWGEKSFGGCKFNLIHIVGMYSKKKVFIGP